MLYSLYIKNLAIIDEVFVTFEDGLNIITGETGSGKTLIIKSIQLLLGNRFTTEMLRKEANQLIIEGVFKQNNEELTIRRLFRKNGQSKSFINDEPVKQKDLLKITHQLVDLHGQHQHQNLLIRDTHLEYLDAFGDYSSKIEAFKKLYNEMIICKKTLTKLQDGQCILLEKEELQNFQLNELTRYPIDKEYEKEVSEKYQTLVNAQTIKDHLSMAVDTLEDGDFSVINRMNQLSRSINKAGKYNRNILDIFNRINSNIIELDDILQAIHYTNKSILIDDAQINELSEIIEHLEMLKRKYGGNIDSVIEFLENLKNINEETKDNYKEIEKLKNELNELEVKIQNKVKLISKKRHDTAIELEALICKNLHNLNMPDTSFLIKLITDIHSMNKNGIDDCEFFIATNRGDVLQPLSKIVSGGEISRIMLAIKMVFQSQDMVSTLIFDEIDLGISGVVADLVGSTIKDLSKSHQIICITHLSQIAGKGDHHYKVQKKQGHKGVVVEMAKIQGADRIQEIATLISGQNITDASRKQAKILLDNYG